MSLKDRVREASSQADLFTLIQGSQDDPDLIFCLDSPFARKLVHDQVQARFSGGASSRDRKDADPTITVRWFASHPEEALHVMLSQGPDRFAPHLTQKQLLSALHLGPSAAMEVRLLQYHTPEGHEEAVQELPRAMSQWLDTFIFQMQGGGIIDARSPHYFFEHYSAILLPLLPPITIRRLIEVKDPLVSIRMIRICWNANQAHPEAPESYPRVTLKKDLEAIVHNTNPNSRVDVTNILFILDAHHRMVLDLMPTLAVQQLIERLITQVEHLISKGGNPAHLGVDATARTLAFLCATSQIRSRLDEDWSDHMFVRSQQLWPMVSTDVISDIVLRHLRLHKDNPGIEPLPILESTMTQLVASTDPALRKAVILGTNHLRIVELAEYEDVPDLPSVESPGPRHAVR